MKIELDDTAVTAELLGFLRSFDCSAQAVAPRLLEVEFEQPARLDRIRLDAFIGVWNALHPTAHATLRDERSVSSV